MRTAVTIRRLPGERWTEAYDGYWLSSKGRWFSVKTKRLLRQHPNSSGYYRPCITVNGEKIQPFTHIKVVELFGDCNGNFIPENNGTLRELRLSIDHLNRDKRDNRQANLEITTHAENCKRKFIKNRR